MKKLYTGVVASFLSGKTSLCGLALVMLLGVGIQALSVGKTEKAGEPANITSLFSENDFATDLGR